MNIDLKNFIPSGNRILIKEIPTETIMPTSGLYLGDEDKDFKTCTVIRLGDGTPMTDNSTRNWDFTIKEGDRVIIPARSGTAITINDETYILIKNQEVLAYIKNA